MNLRARSLEVQLGAWCFALCAFVFALIVLGALVRAHGAGLACPDWPLCFGEFIPAFDLKVAFEWTHRVAAGAVTLVFAGLAFCIVRDARLVRFRAHIVGAGALLLLQIFLGALTVWRLLAEWTVTAHLLAGNAFNATLFVLALRLCETRPRARPPVSAALARALFAIGALFVLQLALGGWVASGHAGLACPEWPACSGGVWFPTWRGAVGLQLAHRIVAYALLAALVAAAFWTRRHGVLGRVMAAAAALGAAQVLVGVANVLLALPVELTALHSALAALLVLVLVAGGREVVLGRGGDGGLNR